MTPLYSPDDLAELLAIPVATLAQWRHRGLGPAYLTVGRHVRYRRADVETWLDGQQSSPRAS